MILTILFVSAALNAVEKNLREQIEIQKQIYEKLEAQELETMRLLKRV